MTIEMKLPGRKLFLWLTSGKLRHATEDKDHWNGRTICELDEFQEGVFLTPEEFRVALAQAWSGGVDATKVGGMGFSEWLKERGL